MQKYITLKTCRTGNGHIFQVWPNLNSKTNIKLPLAKQLHLPPYFIASHTTSNISTFPWFHLLRDTVYVNLFLEQRKLDRPAQGVFTFSSYESDDCYTYIFSPFVACISLPPITDKSLDKEYCLVILQKSSDLSFWSINFAHSLVTFTFCFLKYDCHISFIHILKKSSLKSLSAIG